MRWKDSWLAFDSETSGLTPNDRVIALAYVRFDRGKHKKPTRHLFNPGIEALPLASKHCAETVLEAQGVSLKAYSEAPTFESQLKTVRTLFSEHPVWVAVNYGWEEAFIADEFASAGDDFFALASSKLILDPKTLHAYLTEATDKRKLGLRNVLADWGVGSIYARLQMYPGVIGDAFFASEVLRKMSSYLPDDAEEMREIQRRADAYYRELTQRETRH